MFLCKLLIPQEIQGNALPQTVSGDYLSKAVLCKVRPYCRWLSYVSRWRCSGTGMVMYSPCKFCIPIGKEQDTKGSLLAYLPGCWLGPVSLSPNHTEITVSVSLGSNSTQQTWNIMLEMNLSQFSKHPRADANRLEAWLVRVLPASLSSLSNLLLRKGKTFYAITLGEDWFQPLDLERDGNFQNITASSCAQSESLK